MLLPDGYGHDGSHAMLMALHNFGGDAAGFAKLIHAERVIEQGTVVVLPQAAGLIAEWQGPGITLTFSARRRDGHPVDDVAGLAQTLAVVRRLYRIDPADINLVGFSQGATLALTLARHLARQTPEPARRVFMVAGSVAGPRNGALEMPSADLFAYEPGRNGPQDVANFLTGEPGERAFLPAIIAANGCVLTERTTDHGVDARTYRCRDGQKLVHLFEPKGEHAWPGQDAKYDSWLMGSGSGSHVDFTGLMADEIGRPRAPR